MKKTLIFGLLFVAGAFAWIPGLGPRKEENKNGLKKLMYDSLIVNINSNVVDPAPGDSIYILRKPQVEAVNSIPLYSYYFPSCFFFGVHEDYMLLDCGTGPEPRGFTYLNLKTGKKEFEGSYFEIEKVKDYQMIYWESKAPADSANCKIFFECRKGGNPSEVIQRVSVDIRSKEKTVLGETNCVCTQ
jgi:hypothetical protein